MVGGVRVRVLCQWSNGGFQYSLCEQIREIKLWILFTDGDRTRNRKVQLGNGGVGSGVINEIREACFLRMGSKTVRLKAVEVEDVSAFGVRLKAVDRRFHYPRALGAFVVMS